MAWNPTAANAALRGAHGASGLSRAEIAEIAEISPSALTGYENKEDRVGGMSLKTAWKLADIYKVSLDELVGRKGDE